MINILYRFLALKKRLGVTLASLLYVAIQIGLDRLELLRNDQIINNKKT